MSNPYINTEIKVQKDSIELLKNLGYEFISEDENKLLRNNLKEVILKDILKEQLNKLNSYNYKGKTYKFSEKSIENAIADLDVPLTEGLIKSNEHVYDQLILGNSYEETLDDCSKRSFSIKYIDFDNPENNVFHVTEEYTVQKQNLNQTERNKRPDLILFVNGIPLGIIELKRTSVSVETGISQVINYQNRDYIPHLFRYIQIAVAGNPGNVYYATTGTEKKFWSVWKEDLSDDLLNSIVKNRIPTKLDKDIYSLFNKARFLEIIKEYTIFDANIKKIARYQQYFAIKETLKSIDNFDANGIRSGGLIWHTQGSGKSLTMVMLTRALKRKINNSKIVVVTDRVDLDKQIKETFLHARLDVLRATTGQNLVKFLKENKDAVITTVINKFESAMRNDIINDSSNVFVLVDESHRTQYGTFHAKMKKTFPHACYIGFTGTPLMKKEKNSFNKFGHMIHKYTMDQAVADKAVVPLLYEGREVPQEITDKKWLDKKFELISRDLSDEQKEDLKKKWAIFQKVASSERRLEVIAIDINEHFKKNLLGTGFNAMLATNSKFEAVRYHKIFENYGDIKTAFVISPPDLKEGVEELDDENKKLVQNEWGKIIKNYGSEEDYEDRIKSEFKAGEIDLLIVVDKLLTGFDSPRTTTLYVDKELKDHRLLQAIARVNRLYDEKDCGFIIDYRGLLGKLDMALTSYTSLANFDEEDLGTTMINTEQEIHLFKNYYSHLIDLFKPVKNKNDREEYEVFLANNDLRKEFYKYLKHYVKHLGYALSSEQIYDLVDDLKKYKNALKFYVELRKNVSLRYYERIDFGKYEEHMQKLLDTYIGASDVEHLTELVNIFDVENFNREIVRVEGGRAKADLIKSAVEKHIKHSFDENPVYYQSLSDRIKEVLDKYHEKRISDEEYLKSMQHVLKDVQSKNMDLKTYPTLISESQDAKIIFDNIYEYFGEYTGNGFEDDLAELSLKFDSEIKKNLKVNWVESQDVHNSIKQGIDDILWNLEDEMDISVDNEKIIEKIMTMAISRYGKL
ncbi:type I site-specific deoxyribonuclease, HsdR family [Methanococcus maripaludis C5]|uniref:type I site-specific deoxyribonuclease n=1 Tax=Methanococcus maripaludis (strain C5 / ATCC BAA-1333) TaxID=402880 RepID=A4FXJ4_METM5|nr:type I restriction endonuclease subunit R [Methanococcus maripaludis]ABO34928.1 type I site-specific deoxyribonuclease, HsdR family [Methanococcus maripaludis C5]